MRKKFQEHKRAKEAINESRNRLLRRAKQRSIDSETELQIVPPQTKKMSEIIIVFAQPLMDAATSPVEQKRQYRPLLSDGIYPYCQKSCNQIK